MEGRIGLRFVFILFSNLSEHQRATRWWLSCSTALAHKATALRLSLTLLAAIHYSSMPAEAATASVADIDIPTPAAPLVLLMTGGSTWSPQNHRFSREESSFSVEES